MFRNSYGFYSPFFLISGSASTAFGIGIILQGSSSVVLEYDNYVDLQTTLKVRERSSKLLNSSDCRVLNCAQTIERIKLLM